MSTPVPPSYAPFQSQPPVPKKRFNWKLALIVFAAMLIGGVIGSVSNPAPPPVVQVEVQEKIVEKEVTPVSCVSALDHAESYMASSARAADLFTQTLDAIQAIDPEKLDSLNPKIRAETNVIEEIAPKYLTESRACRSK